MEGNEAGKRRKGGEHWGGGGGKGGGGRGGEGRGGGKPGGGMEGEVLTMLLAGRQLGLYTWTTLAHLASLVDWLQNVTPSSLLLVARHAYPLHELIQVSS